MPYSRKIENTLKKQGIDIGAKVKLTTSDRSYEGILMPQSGGDSNVLVLKLKSGYNVGVVFGKDAKLERLEKASKLGVIPTKKIAHRKGLPVVSLITTGGTIGTHVDYKTGGVFMCRTPEEILATVPEIGDVVNIRNVSSPFTMASEDMWYKSWEVLAEEVVKELKDSDGVIITHGTDTLHYTSAALSFMLQDLTKPVALVGAQRSPDRGSFDGAMNLLCAARLMHTDIAGVTVVMHGSINDDYCFVHRGTKVRKLHTSRRDAFRSVNELPIAKIWPDGKTEMMNKNYTKRQDKEVKADTAFEEKVALVKAYPNSLPEVIDWYAKKKFRGIVIEATGLGHVPTGKSGTKALFDRKYSWIPYIKKAVDSGVVVCMTSQCIYGRVNPFVYRNLRLAHKAGALYLEDMLPETAYVKLGWVLGHTKDANEARNMMLENMAGEITKRTDVESYSDIQSC